MCHPWQSQGKHTAQCCDPFRVGTKGEGLLRSTDLAGNFQVICSWELCWDLGSGMSKENSFSFNTIVFIFSPGFSHLGLHARHIGRYCIHKMVPDSAVPIFPSSEPIWAGCEWEEESGILFHAKKHEGVKLKVYSWEKRELFRRMAARCSVKLCVHG